MNIEIIHNAQNAKEVAIIIDVFRAFTVEPYIINNGGNVIIPVGEKELAYKLKEENPDYILIGERNGIKLPGFDYGNSPTSIKDVNFKGKTVIHTTSCGTQGIDRAIKANVNEIFTGSLVNAKATVEYIKKQTYNNVSIVSLARPGEEPFDEDELCAKYLYALFKNQNTDFLKEEIIKLKYTSGKKFFDNSLKDIFPENDFYLCTEVNKLNIVLKVNKNDNKHIFIENIL